ncbi:MAG: LytTR family DNA-binding domain-containing protein [Chitinophagaceae bacterium]|nr:LytTR family DNA-binding domain-containing protein [Chitinophagaceae bacterium]
MTILIIEDEPLVAISLAKLVRELEPGVVIFGPLASVRESKQWLQSHPQPDLVLADIQLADGISLDIFSANKPGCPVIFTTAYNEYAIRAFKVNSIDYLLKPVDRKELESALKKFHLLQSKFTDENYLKEMMDLFRDLNKSKKFKERFAVHSGRSVVLTPVQELVYFVKEELIYLVNSNGQRFITDYRSLDEVEELVDPKTFYRANRQHLVHLPFIESFRSDDTGKLVLKMKNLKTDDIIVSKEKAAEFRKWFE